MPPRPRSMDMSHKQVTIPSQKELATPLLPDLLTCPLSMLCIFLKKNVLNGACILIDLHQDVHAFTLCWVFILSVDKITPK